MVLCDTNGGTLPEEVEAIVAEVAKAIPGDHLGIHAHNDTEQAVANSLAAVRAGARQIQGTLNGIGERCGNANLTSLIPTLMLKPAYAERFEIGVDEAGLADLTQLAHRFDELVNRAPNRQAPYVGASAFATKAGIHASAIVKDPEDLRARRAGEGRQPPPCPRLRPGRQGQSHRRTAAHGPARSIATTAVSRRCSARSRSARRAAIPTRAPAPRSSCSPGARSANVPNYFDVESFHVTVERRHNALGELVSVSEAVVKMIVGGERLLTVGEGNGPVNALDHALRKDLGVYQRRSPTSN